MFFTELISLHPPNHLMGLQILKTRILSVTHSSRSQKPVVTESGNDSSPTVRGLSPFPGESHTSSHIIFHSASFQQVYPLLPCPFSSKQESSLGSGSPHIYGCCCLQEIASPDGPQSCSPRDQRSWVFLVVQQLADWLISLQSCVGLSLCHAVTWAPPAPAPEQPSGVLTYHRVPEKNGSFSSACNPTSAKGSVGCLTLELGQGPETEPSCSPSPLPSEAQASLCILHRKNQASPCAGSSLLLSSACPDMSQSSTGPPSHTWPLPTSRVCHLSRHTGPFLTRGSALGLMLCCCRELLITFS